MMSESKGQNPHELAHMWMLLIPSSFICDMKIFLNIYENSHFRVIFGILYRITYIGKKREGTANDN